jgi:anti-sigma B factor antagonist
VSREATDGLRRPPVDGIERKNGSAVVRLVGEIDLYNAEEVAGALAELAGEHHGRVVVDLSEVEFVDSTALGTLIEARKQLGDGALVLAAPGQEVRRALEVAGLIDHFPVRNTVDAALES